MIGQPTPLKGRVLKSGAWTVGGFVLIQVLRLGSNLILTRLLFPEAFGLMSIVYVLMAGMTLLSDLGIHQSIIQNQRGNDNDFLNTAWSLKILRGLLICMTIIFFAFMLPKAVSMGWVPVGSVYADPMLPALLIAFSITAILQGVSSTNIALAQRNLQLGKYTQIEVIGQVVAMVVMVLLAWVYHNVWALVAGAVISELIRCVMSHYYLPGPSNRLHWDSDCFKEIFHFGKWVFLLSIIGFMAINGDRLMLGGLLTPSILGIYAIAMLLISSGKMLFDKVLSSVVFPAFSEVVGSTPEIVLNLHSRFQLIADLFLFGTAGFLFVAGESIINLLYDDRYRTAGSMLSVLGVGLIGARHGVVEQLWLATATMRPLLISHASRLILLFAGIPFGYDQAGMHGALVAIVISSFAGWPIAFYYRLKHGLVNWKYEFVGVPVFVVLAMFGGGLSWLVL